MQHCLWNQHVFCLAITYLSNSLVGASDALPDVGGVAGGVLAAAAAPLPPVVRILQLQRRPWSQHVERSLCGGLRTLIILVCHL